MEHDGNEINRHLSVNKCVPLAVTRIQMEQRVQISIPIRPNLYFLQCLPDSPVCETRKSFRENHFLGSLINSRLLQRAVWSGTWVNFLSCCSGKLFLFFDYFLWKFPSWSPSVSVDGEPGVSWRLMRSNFLISSQGFSLQSFISPKMSSESDPFFFPLWGHLSF